MVVCRRGVGVDHLESSMTDPGQGAAPPGASRFAPSRPVPLHDGRCGAETERDPLC